MQAAPLHANLLKGHLVGTPVNRESLAADSMLFRAVLLLCALLRSCHADADNVAPLPGYVADYPPGLTDVDASDVVPAAAPGAAPAPGVDNAQDMIIQVRTATELYNAINEGAAYVEILEHLDLTKLPTANAGNPYPKHFDHTKLQTLRVRLCRHRHAYPIRQLLFGDASPTCVEIPLSFVAQDMPHTRQTRYWLQHCTACSTAT